MQNRFDQLVAYLLEDDKGKPRGFALQTALDFIGIPTILSIGDILGVMRGYLNVRQGNNLKGFLMVFTAILPWFPTGPVHYLIEKMLSTPNQPWDNSMTKYDDKPVPAKVVK